MTDKLKPGTKAWDARMERHKHNSFIGHATMMRQNCRSIISSSTATEVSKSIAHQIESLLNQLEASLRKGRRS